MLAIYADGIPPDPKYINTIINDYNICGFTCNPTLIKNYLPITYYDYCKTIIDHSKGFPVSIQILTSNMNEMIEQAKIISSWGSNVFVKIPVINEYGESCISSVIIPLLKEGLKINITAIFSAEQIESLLKEYDPSHNIYILSFFSGRISDMGLNPNKLIKPIYALMTSVPSEKRGKILWAGARQVVDLVHAKKYCDIITIPKSVIDKLNCTIKTKNQYCKETVQMFANDSKSFSL